MQRENTEELTRYKNRDQYTKKRDFFIIAAAMLECCGLLPECPYVVARVVTYQPKI